MFKFIKVDLSQAGHRTACLRLLNAYILDEMGGGFVLSKERGERLTDDLHRHPAKFVLFAQDDGLTIGSRS
ncbi:MAG: hypothetical protein V2A70_04730 [Candidatus Omnitrophota bacterium]